MNRATLASNSTLPNVGVENWSVHVTAWAGPGFGTRVSARTGIVDTAPSAHRTRDVYRRQRRARCPPPTHRTATRTNVTGTSAELSSRKFVIIGEPILRAGQLSPWSARPPTRERGDC